MSGWCFCPCRSLAVKGGNPNHGTQAFQALSHRTSEALWAAKTGCGSPLSEQGFKCAVILSLCHPAHQVCAEWGGVGAGKKVSHLVSGSLGHQDTEYSVVVSLELEAGCGDGVG